MGELRTHEVSIGVSWAFSNTLGREAAERIKRKPHRWADERNVFNHFFLTFFKWKALPWGGHSLPACNVWFRS